MTIKTRYDILVIGGGINGVAIAADAAGRGLSVALCEQGDLASGTSSSSSQLIHGGLRYLEHFAFRLVRESLQEREILLEKAPHLIRPLRFVLPYQPQRRPAWLVQLGLFVYDHLAKRKTLPGSQRINLRNDPCGRALKSSLKTAFCYSDCWTDDVRLVILNALAAKAHGATILTHHRLIQATRSSQTWDVVLEDQHQEQHALQAHCVINATGPWIKQVASTVLQIPLQHTVRLVKGSHIIVPRQYEGDHAYVLPTADQRVVFVLPYQNDYHCIGTTDVEISQLPETVTITDQEQDYLCNSVNAYFEKPITPDDILHSYSGIRPLFGADQTNPSAVSRDYALELDYTPSLAPALTVFGGKLTTHRKLAEAVVDKLKPLFPQITAPWTAHVPLPGSNLQDYHLPAWLPPALATRYLQSYGQLASSFLIDKQGLADLGEDFGHGLYAAEVNYLKEHEWAETAEDILWRRTKLGIAFSAEECDRLAEWLNPT